MRLSRILNALLTFLHIRTRESKKAVISTPAPAASSSSSERIRMETSPNMAYQGLVDMGSNGIRFSITSLAPPTERLLPTIYQDRAAISLYDAQYSPAGVRIPIPGPTITAVIAALLRFRTTCADFAVPESQIRVLATEATRAASNSAAFLAQIKEATGWTVELLPKEIEGQIGAFGVASSYANVSGLVMDLGGGSTQISWMRTAASGAIELPPSGAVSLPYGAAALSQALAAARKKGGSAREDYKASVTRDLVAAVAALAIPATLLNAKKETKEATLGGCPLYLSGGGFRGWGFVLMASHAVSPYPIPIINGFHAETAAFLSTATVTNAVQVSAISEDTPDIFRVSERRAGQVPAVAFLVSCLAEALPEIRDVFFAQGGVREGALFRELPAEIRAQDPFVVATLPLSPSPDSVPQLVEMLKAAAPHHPFEPAMLTTFAQAMYKHASLPKDITAGSALRSTTTGILASTHGVSHTQRAVLATLLCERYGGVSRLSPSEQEFYSRIVRLLLEGEAWWCKYVGSVAGVLASVYPAGVVREERVRVKAGWGDGKKGRVLNVDFGFGGRGIEYDEGLVKAVKGVEKVGKKKNRAEGWKVRVTVDGEGFEG